MPPLAEQQRIVAKVDELMAVCDRLEEQLNTVHFESIRLLEAVLHNVLSYDSPLGELRMLLTMVREIGPMGLRSALSNSDPYRPTCTG